MTMIKTLREIFFTWRIRTSTVTELADADVTIALAFGIGDGNPGKSNRDLGVLTESYARELKIPVIARWLIAGFITENLKIGVTGSSKDQEYQWLPAHRKYVDTYQELAQAVDICKKHGKKKPLILAEPDHYWRVIRTAETFGYFEKILTADTSMVRKDPHSKQIWTRNQFLFRLYERGARLWYLLNGYIAT